MHSDEANRKREGWNNLRKIVRQYFSTLRASHPNWHIEDLMSYLGLPRTKLLTELAVKEGFKPRDEATEDEIRSIEEKLNHGVWSDQVIADETDIPLHRVGQILSSQNGEYGTTPYGTGSFGEARAYSDGKTLVPRRVTVVGQLKYRGKSYTLGHQYRGRTALVLEAENMLIIRFADLPDCKVIF